MDAGLTARHPFGRISAIHVLALYALIGGLLSLAGWIADVPWLTDWPGSGISIQPNATLCVVLSGLSLLLLESGRRRAGALLGAGVAVVGGLTLLEWALGASFGIDTMLRLDRPWGQRGVLYPGRMGPPGSLAWTMIGIALVISGLQVPRPPRMVIGFAIATLAISLLSITGHLYDADVLYTMPRLTVIAPQTATFIAAVSAGVVALHPQYAPMCWLVRADAVGMIARRAVPTVLVAPIVLGWLGLQGERLGVYDVSFGIALLVLMLIMLLSAVLWRGLATIARHDAALMASEARMQLAIEAGDAATWDLDMVTGQNTWSESHFRLLGYPPPASRVSAREIWENAVHDDDRDAVQAEWQRAVAAHDVYRAEHRLRRLDGTILWARSAGRFFYDDKGETAIRFVGVMFDLTAEKQAFESLREADRHKDEFLAVLAHELRNPLAPVRNAVRVLQKQLLPEAELRWATDVIDRQVAQMSRLIDDLLDVGRINRGMIALKREVIELAAVVQDAVEASRPLIEQCGHQLEVTLPRELVALEADAVRLSQVVCNLLNNAAKYTPAGGHIRLVAATTRDEVSISVRDDGIGIPAELMPRVFDMFAQVGQAQTHQRDGLGIGLSLVKRLVELHGGRIEARSAGTGLGSEFTVHLPRPALPVRVPTDTAEVKQAAAGPAVRVLVVDDNHDAADSLALLLQLHGNDARAVYDGEQCMEVASTYRPRCIILDIGLPGSSGYDIARAIRAVEWGRDVVLIALTGWGQESDRQKSAAAGFDHHLVKPVAPDELMALLAGVA